MNTKQNKEEMEVGTQVERSIIPPHDSLDKFKKGLKEVCEITKYCPGCGLTPRGLEELISQAIKERDSEVVRMIKKLHDKYMKGDIREDIKNCTDKDCNHYILGADDLYHDIITNIEAK